MTKNQYLCDCASIHPEAVARARAHLPPHASITIIAHLFKLLGDPTRLRLCFALSQQELCVCDLANLLSMSKSSISHQLRLLREQHIVRARRSGKEIYYSLDDTHVHEILAMSLAHINHNQESKYA